MGALSNFGFGYFPGGELNPLPAFSYTGSATLIDDGSGNWRIKFLTSGVLRMSKAFAIDVFLVGGGGGASWFGAGGGGYTTTEMNFSLAADVDYSILIGAKGSGVGAALAGNGSASMAFGFQALGGNGGRYNNGNGGDGGSGGGAGGYTVGGTGGTNGGNGADVPPAAGGAGQSTTTKEFGTGDEYAKGGNGGGAEEQIVPTNATPNTGNGGDGSGGNAVNGADGATGIVIIRNHAA